MRLLRAMPCFRRLNAQGSDELLGGDMGQAGSGRAKELAQNLVEILTSYEEELMLLEREVPAMGQLRRAVGITIAEACYLITDQGLAQAEWIPPSDGSTRHAS